MKQKFWLFAILFSLASFAQLPAQSDWFDDEEDEETTAAVAAEAWDIPAGKMDQVKIRLAGEDVQLEDEYTFQRKDTLDIQVRHLSPGSPVSLHMKKGGINLKKKVYYANHRGQLDLEVRTGTKKVKGSATLYYTTSSGKKKEHDVRIILE